MAGNAAAVTMGVFNFLADPEVQEQIKTYVDPLVTSLIAWYNGPSKENSTILEIEDRLRRQGGESVKERERRIVQERKAIEQQQREVDQQKRNDLAISQAIEEKNRELRMLKDTIARLRVEALRSKAEEDMRTKKATRRAQVIRRAEQGILADAKRAEETKRAQAEERRITEAETRRTEAQRIQVGQVVDRSRTDRRYGVARQVEERRRIEDETRLAVATLEAEAKEIKEQTENARQAEEMRRVEDEERRIEELTQVEEAKRAEDERLSAEAANEERRVDTAKILQAKIEAEKTTARITIEKDKLQQACLETKRQYSQKIRLAIWPYLQEYETAKEKIQYDRRTFRFAVAGFTGTGKSSIINVFLNLPPKHKDGAPTGINETTRTITRYPDPGDKPPRKWTVWHDVPGAGTANIPTSRYFINQCLFLMDVILVLVGDRFTEIDLEIISQCRSFDIPSMIIRSKSDTHIDNMVKSRAEETDVEIDDALRSACREEYIAETRENIATQLLENCLPPQYVYLVSCSPSKPFRKAYSSFAGGPTYEGFPAFIDEMKLIQDLMIAANRRRDWRTPGHQDNTQQDVAPGDVSAREIALGAESDSTDKSQSVKEPAHARIKDEAAHITMRGKRYSWGHQQESTGAQSSSGKYIPPGRKPLSLSTKPAEIVPSNAHKNITEIKPSLTPIQAAITTITLALARPGPVSLSAEIFRDIDIDVNGTQLLVLSITRELAIYINSALQKLPKPLNLRSVVCAGGLKVPNGYQHIVSGTPARVAHLIANGSLQMTNMRTLILNMEQDIPENLHQQIYDVYRQLPPDIKILRGIMKISSTGSK